MVDFDSSNLIALVALMVSLVAFTVAVADWLQIGREEPWNSTWTDNGTCILKRQHYWPVWIEGFLNFHGGGVSTMNDATFPHKLMHRNDSVVIQVHPTVVGTVLHVFYRRATPAELIRRGLFNVCVQLTTRSNISKGPRLRWIGELAQRRFSVQNRYWSFDAMSGKKSWVTPIVHRYDAAFDTE